MRSTSGVLVALTGPNSFFPISALSKRQSCVSHSTPEAELVAVDLAIRTEGLPALDLWSLLLQDKKLKIDFQEDNQACIQVLKTGKNPTMRHLGRTHKVCVAWLHEQFQGDNMNTSYCDSALQCADVFTKAFTDKLCWNPVCRLIAHFLPEDLDFKPKPCGRTRCFERDKSPNTWPCTTRGDFRDAGGVQAEQKFWFFDSQTLYRVVLRSSIDH